MAADIVFRLFRCALVKIPNAFRFFSLFPRPAFSGLHCFFVGFSCRSLEIPKLYNKISIREYNEKCSPIFLRRRAAFPLFILSSVLHFNESRKYCLYFAYGRKGIRIALPFKACLKTYSFGGEACFQAERLAESSLAKQRTVSHPCST